MFIYFRGPTHDSNLLAVAFDSSYWYEYVHVLLFQAFFFRRMKEGPPLPCRYDGNCDIITKKTCDITTKKSRTKCQGCRYRKCLDVGMQKSGMYIVHVIA